MLAKKLTGKGTEFSLRKVRNSSGEYVVRCWVDGKHYADGDYFTDDWQDAKNTLVCAVRRYSHENNELQ